nr:MAG TPA: hypothetical protein [Caudoviricetes sp.]
MPMSTISGLGTLGNCENGLNLYLFVFVKEI